MRLLLGAGFVTLAGVVGCAALDGLGDYRECAACSDAASDLSDRASLEPPVDAGDSSADEAALANDEPPPSGEASDSLDANLDDVSPVSDSATDARAHPAEAGTDAGFDAATEAAAPPILGATCGPRGTTTRCSGKQVCCANLAANTNACAATCAPSASLSCVSPSDCPASAPICCASLSLAIDSRNDPPPMCTITAFSSSCASTCADAPPASCTFQGTIRLCTHDADCPSASLSNQCWNYNGDPESWCTNATLGAGGGGVHQP